MKKVNHESDFIATLTLPTEAVNADFIIEFSTRGNATYTASRIGTVYTNCALVNSQIVVGFRNHKLPCGMLNAKYALLLDNGYMSDGILRKVVPNVEAVELVTGRGDDEAISLSLVTDLSLESLYNMVRLHGYTDTEFKFYESWIAALKNTVVSGDTTIGVNFVLEGYLHCASAQIGGKDVTAEKITQWDTAYTNSHTHANKTVIDGIDQNKTSSWDTASANSHTHPNKATLDGVSGTKVGEWNNKVASVVLDGLLLKVNNAGTVVTYSVPIASDTANGAVSTTAQTYAGRKTFKNGIIANGIDFESDTQIAQQWFKSNIDGVMTTFGAIGTYGNGIDMFIACQRSGKQLYLANDGRLGYGDWDNGMAYLKVEKDADGNAIFSYENNIKTPNYIQIGDYRIVVDTANNALKIVKADGTAANLIVSGGTTIYE